MYVNRHDIIKSVHSANRVNTGSVLIMIAGTCLREVDTWLLYDNPLIHGTNYPFFFIDMTSLGIGYSFTSNVFDNSSRLARTSR